jgi:NAD(P)-dependent dehydrogenase (short-subunit alcohol dehydrogenase family)
LRTPDAPIYSCFDSRCSASIMPFPMHKQVPNLTNSVAVISGASQGVGRGIALSLGDAGATVYLTGRNQSALACTAAQVSERGGRAIGIVCDHATDSQVEALFHRIRQEQPGIDLLVNNIWGGYEAHPQGLGISAFWQLGLEDWDAMFNRGLRAHFVMSRFAAPLMLPRERGLIVNTIAWAQGKYLRHLYYDVVKQAVARMAYGMALELKPHKVAAVAVAPGFVRTERVMAAHAAHPFDLSATESPEYIGRAVTYLAADPEVMKRTGQVLTAGQLAREYGFTDTDGRQPPPFDMPASMALD